MIWQHSYRNRVLRELKDVSILYIFFILRDIDEFVSGYEWKLKIFQSTDCSILGQIPNGNQFFKVRLPQKSVISKFRGIDINHESGVAQTKSYDW